MITRSALENFKCFREVEVKPKRITVFIGPNGSGKSSVL
jgi:AAA15 family ATPase/GTPase